MAFTEIGANTLDTGYAINNSWRGNGSNSYLQQLSMKFSDVFGSLINDVNDPEVNMLRNEINGGLL